MNWDSVINIGMFVLGTCFIIVATAQLIFMDDDDDDDDMEPFVEDDNDDYDGEWAEDFASPEELRYKAIDHCLETVSKQIREQDDIRVALIMVDGASFATQALIDKELNDV
jgi:hypothetical protein